MRQTGRRADAPEPPAAALGRGHCRVTRPSSRRQARPDRTGSGPLPGPGLRLRRVRAVGDPAHRRLLLGEAGQAKPAAGDLPPHPRRHLSAYGSTCTSVYGETCTAPTVSRRGDRQIATVVLRSPVLAEQRPHFRERRSREQRTRGDRRPIDYGLRAVSGRSGRRPTEGPSSSRRADRTTSATAGGIDRGPRRTLV